METGLGYLGYPEAISNYSLSLGSRILDMSAKIQIPPSIPSNAKVHLKGGVRWE